MSDKENLKLYTGKMIVSPKRRNQDDTDVIVYSNDINTSKFVYKLRDAENNPIDLNDASVDVVLLFGGCDTKNNSKAILKAEIEDQSKGVVSFIIPKQFLGFQGEVFGEFDVRFNDNQSATAGHFYFNMKHSYIDSDTETIKEIYIQHFDDLEQELKDKIDEIIAGIKPGETPSEPATVEDNVDDMSSNDYLIKTKNNYLALGSYTTTLLVIFDTYKVIKYNVKHDKFSSNKEERKKQLEKIANDYLCALYTMHSLTGTTEIVWDYVEFDDKFYGIDIGSETTIQSVLSKIYSNVVPNVLMYTSQSLRFLFERILSWNENDDVSYDDMLSEFERNALLGINEISYLDYAPQVLANLQSQISYNYNVMISNDEAINKKIDELHSSNSNQSKSIDLGSEKYLEEVMSYKLQNGMSSVLIKIIYDTYLTLYSNYENKKFDVIQEERKKLLDEIGNDYLKSIYTVLGLTFKGGSIEWDNVIFDDEYQTLLFENDEVAREKLESIFPTNAYPYSLNMVVYNLRILFAQLAKGEDEYSSYASMLSSFVNQSYFGMMEYPYYDMSNKFSVDGIQQLKNDNSDMIRRIANLEQEMDGLKAEIEALKK